MPTVQLTAKLPQKQTTLKRGLRVVLIRCSFALLASALIIYAVVSVYVSTQLTAERHMPNGTPADVGLLYEPVSFESAVDHVPLAGWYLPSAGTRAVVLVHGLDGNRWDTNGPWLPRVIPLFVRNGFDVLLFDLRAHGESGGQHVGLGSLERRDVQAAVTLVERRGIGSGRIGLFGQSFGAATALLSTAAIPDVAAVASDSAFADARLVLDQEIHRYTGLPGIFTPGIALVSSALYGIDINATPERAMAQIAPRPVLLIHGTADSRIPVENAYKLKAASTSPGVDLWIVPGAEHTESYLVEPELYSRKIVSFFDEALGTR